jgi:hypothetical protein
MRPSFEELAEARRKAQWFLATVPDHSIASALRTFLETTAPVTKGEALPVMVKHANEAGNWEGRDGDAESAKLALIADDAIGRSGWQDVVWAQWKTLRYFMGGAE